MRSNAIVVLILCTVSGSMAGCNEPAMLNVETAHEDDQIHWLTEPLPTFRVQSRTGIGSARVTPEEEGWPAGFKVVLELAALEGFVVRSGDETHRLEVTHDGQVLLEPIDSRVLHMNHMQAIGEAFRFSIRVNPNNFADPASAVRVEWVDYYR